MSWESNLGKADWIYDYELGVHIPCCTAGPRFRRCGNGPLVGQEIRDGLCSIASYDETHRPVGELVV